jgi:hypothetical protein
MPRVASTFGSTLSGRSIFAIRPSFLIPRWLFRAVSHGFGYAATDAMGYYEPPAMSRQYEHGLPSIMLRLRIAKGTPLLPYYVVRLILSGTTLRAPPFESQPDRSYTVRPARPSGWARYLQTAAAPGTAMESANCAPAECWGPPSLDNIVLPPSREPQVGRTWPLRIFSSSGPLAVGVRCPTSPKSKLCHLGQQGRPRHEVLRGPGRWNEVTPRG